MARKTYYKIKPQKLDLYKRQDTTKRREEKPLERSKEDVVNMALIAMRRKNLDTVQDNERLKKITENLNKRIRRSDQSKVSDIVHYWMSKLHT